MVNSINKGKSFERQIAKILSDMTQVDWKRVPMSGAFSTINKSEDNRFFGDLFTENKLYSNIIIECKKTKAPITLFEIFNKKSRLNEFISQTEKESKDKDWVLIFSWNNSKIFYLTNKLDTIKLLKFSNYINVGKYFLGILK